MALREAIKQWAKENYEKSLTAQEVVECYEDEDFADMDVRFESIEEFIEMAKVRDDYAADIADTAF